MLPWLFALFFQAFAVELPVVAILPLGSVKQSDLETVKVGIAARYAVAVEILPVEPLPKSAWYEPRQRYIADEILDALVLSKPRFHKILALTTKDISTTNDEGKNWGIMGLGLMAGRTCIVSTFRLRTGKADDKLFAERLVKVVNQELGHSFGLPHCPNAGCLMQDARGKIATVDGESGVPCGECSARLPLVTPER